MFEGADSSLRDMQSDSSLRDMQSDLLPESASAIVILGRWFASPYIEQRQRRGA